MAKTDEQDVQTPIEDEPVVIEQPIEVSNPNPRSYFFPNDGQPFSCDAANLGEAEKKNTQYLQQLKGAK